MKPAVIRLVLTAGLFAAWLGYLAYLVATRPVNADGTPLVVSRPQVLTSQLDVIAEVTSPDEPAVVEEVLWPAENAPVRKGDRIRIAGIGQARPRPRFPKDNPPADFSGPGYYLIPLRKGDDGYEVAPIPMSPGYLEGPARLYPDTAETRAQYSRIAKPAG